MGVSTFMIPSRPFSFIQRIFLLLIRCYYQWESNRSRSFNLQPKNCINKIFSLTIFISLRFQNVPLFVGFTGADLSEVFSFSGSFAEGFVSLSTEGLLLNEVRKPLGTLSENPDLAVGKFPDFEPVEFPWFPQPRFPSS